MRPDRKATRENEGRGRRPRTSTFALVVATFAVLSVGCGAKTGAYVPDADTNYEPDAGIIEDSGVDASIPTDGGTIEEVCVEVPFGGGPVELSLEVQAEVGRADVVFLLDVTASMREELEQVKERLQDRIAPAIDRAIPDAQLAVATFADYPISGRSGSSYGGREDLPFELRLPMSSDITAVQAALGAIRLGNGEDPPESQVEALYQLATGEGRLPYVPPSAGCPNGGRGYACFRPDALPVVLLFTDARFHNGPDNTEPYDLDDFPGRVVPATYPEAVSELQRIGARVIGFDSGNGLASGALERLAIDTGALDQAGQPLVQDIGMRAQRLGDSVVGAIETFADSVVQDIGMELRDGDPRDGIDPTDFIERVELLGAVPADGIDGVDLPNQLYLGAKFGTQLSWRLIIRNDAIAPAAGSQRFRLEATFVADGRRTIGRQGVIIAVPGADGGGCP